MLEAIRNRRSVRFYRNEPVSDEAIAEVLKAGFCAPSAHGRAPWHAVVVRDQAVKDALAGIHRWSKVIARAPVVIVACVDRSEFDHFWVEDGSTFMENMLIQATELGLGSCWIGVKGIKQKDRHADAEDRDAEAMVREACGLPEHFGVIAITLLGYAARYPGPHEPKLPEDRVKFI